MTARRQVGHDNGRAVLIMVVVTAMVASLDTSSVAVALPSILREFGTSLPATQWIVTCYLLVFGAALLAGGRLGDMYGHRRFLIIGAAFFGVGSLFAGESGGLGSLLAARAILCGLGVAMMMPATGSLVSLTFESHARAKAFALWGAVVGVASAFGPAYGGWLTSEFSWRWCFRINVLASGLIVAVALKVLAPDGPNPDRGRLDVAGVALSGSGMALLVAALSEGGEFGWWRPTRNLTVGPVTVWPVGMPVSIIPVALVASVFAFTAFYRLERSRERDGTHPLLAFGALGARPGFRYGVPVSACIAVGQYGLIFVLPIFLQESLGLTAGRSGVWQLLPGTFIVAGAVVGARVARTMESLGVVRVGLALEAVGLLYFAFAFRGGVTVIQLLPGFVLFGSGVGFAMSQVNNVIVAGVDDAHMGIASASNSISRQIGSMIAACLIASLLAATTVNSAVGRVEASTTLGSAARQRTVDSLRAGGLRFDTPAGLTGPERTEVEGHLAAAVGSGSRAPMLLVSVVTVIGFGFALKIPSRTRRGRPWPR